MVQRKLTLREYTAGFILLIFTFSAVVTFSGDIFTQYDSNLKGESETVQKLQQNIENSSARPSTGTGSDAANSITTEEGTNFFLSSVLTVIETVTDGVSSIPPMMETFVQNLNITTDVIVLASIPVAAVIWEVVSLYRGIRT